MAISMETVCMAKYTQVRNNQNAQARIYQTTTSPYIVTWIIFLFCQVGEQIEAFVTYVTPEGHVFIQITGGGTTRLNELMEDIAEHYSQVNLIQNYYSTIMLFSHIRAMKLEKYATVLHGRAWQKYGWKVEEQNGCTTGSTFGYIPYFRLT